MDFTDPSVADDWKAVDDRIMGGSSRSRVVHADGVTSVEGELVVAGGGFASVRYGRELRLDPEVDSLLMEARGDGRLGYKLTLQTSAFPGGVSYQCLLPLSESPGAEFEQLCLPLSDFRASSRGRAMPDAPPLRAADVRTMGLMLSRYEVGGGVKADIPPGAFRLQLRGLRAVTIAR